MLVTVVIPVYNEEKVINGCLKSLSKQSHSPLEIICVDDGSTDTTVSEITNSPSTSLKAGKSQIPNLILLKQNHKGPGAARNLGAAKATGEILVFVDADMEFEEDFVSKLVQPIISRKTIGTFSKEEYLLNEESAWARCWNLNLGRKANRMHPDDYSDKQEVFRAILKKEFDRAGGFDEHVGYTDDWSLSRKLGILATSVSGTKFYHRNPETLTEVWSQARWYGKNEFLTRNLVRKVYNLIRYCPLFSIIKGVYRAVKFKEKDFLIFKIVFDCAVFTSVLLSFFNERKEK